MNDVAAAPAPMAWIGGAPGAGKSTIARTLARSLDLPLHPIDLWTYDHVARMPPIRPLDLHLADGPEAAADAFVGISRTRLALAVEDIHARGLGDVPALVEGPQLFPSMATDVPVAVWLLPDADWPSITSAVRAQLDELPRLTPGDDLARQREIENQAACRQLRLWAADINLADVPTFDFTCECGRSGCARTWTATPNQYDVRRTAGRLDLTAE